MEIFKIADYIKKPNPKPTERLIAQILEKKAEDLSGLFIILPPGAQTPYHFHNKRETIIIPIAGKATLLLDGKKVPIEVNDIIFIPVKQKHAFLNDSGKEARAIEFQTGNPDEPDRIVVEWSES